MNIRKAYILELEGDIESTPGTVTLEVGGVSLDREVLEKLKVVKDQELDEYLGDDASDEDDDYPEQVVYHNYDLSGRPHWNIREYDLVE